MYALDGLIPYHVLLLEKKHLGYILLREQSKRDFGPMHVICIVVANVLYSKFPKEHSC